MLVFNPELVALNVEAPDAAAVIHLLAGKLHAQGLVSADYGQQTCARETQHPTGLPTTPFCIAFPHADATGVQQSALALAILKTSVVFKNMADPDEALPVDLVLMLANKSPEEQIQTLRNLALLFGQPDQLVMLRGQTDPVAAAAWLSEALGLNQPPPATAATLDGPD